jgi:hypothetical protein
MKDLEEFCKQQQNDLKLFVERRENQYRSGFIERTRVVRPSDIMKAVAPCTYFNLIARQEITEALERNTKRRYFKTTATFLLSILLAMRSYKFEFFTRNRLERENRIYKYYVLCAIGYSHCKSRNIFRLASKEQEKIADSIRVLLVDEERFLEYSMVAVKSIKDLAGEKLGVPLTGAREKLRDVLRTETFSKAFLDQIAENANF